MARKARTYSCCRKKSFDNPMRGSTSSQRAAHLVLATDRVSPGGVSNVMMQLAKHFASAGHRVDIVALGPGEWDSRFTERGLRLHYLPSAAAIRLIRSADIVHCHHASSACWR